MHSIRIYWLLSRWSSSPVWKMMRRCPVYLTASDPTYITERRLGHFVGVEIRCEIIHKWDCINHQLPRSFFHHDICGWHFHRFKHRRLVYSERWRPFFRSDIPYKLKRCGRLYRGTANGSWALIFSSKCVGGFQSTKRNFFLVFALFLYFFFVICVGRKRKMEFPWF